MNTSDKKPLITFVVCCYNVSDYIEDMLESLLYQEYNHIKNKKLVANSDGIEILLVEDCSTDSGKTKKLCNDFQNKYSNVRLIEHKSNQGLSSARNTGITNSNGIYISFPDPDDIVAPGIINEYLKAIEEHDYDCITAGVIERHYNQNNRLILDREISLKEQSLEGSKAIAKASVELEGKVSFGYTWNKLYKTKILNDNSICFKKDLLYIEDLLFNIDYFKKCKSAKIINKPAVIYNRRLNNKQSITATYINDYFKLHYLRVEKLYKYWEEFTVLDNHAKEILGALYLRYALSALWRNKDKRSNMSLKDQNKWLKNFYELEMTKKLLPYAKSDSLKNNILFGCFKTKICPLVLMEASFINFATKYMNKTVTKARQKR